VNLLAVTTSTPAMSVWLRTDSGFDAGLQARGEPGDPPALTKMLWELFQRAGIAPADLGRVACDVGPGSFTGLRQGLCTARALAWAAGKPCAAVGSLAAMVAEVRAGGVVGPVLVALPARRGVAYAGWSPAAGSLEEAVLDDAGWSAWIGDRLRSLGATTPAGAVTACGLPLLPGATTYRTLRDLGLDVRSCEAPPHPLARRVLALALTAPELPPLHLVPRYLLASEAELRAGSEVAAESLPAARS
jgi:tRNA threonylcarbamoyladenosine biosynthesis protein TsaB